MLYFVYLRQPARKDDRRCDPFWEFGSFGLTGCHRANLMHPTRSPLQTGDQLVFLQGGHGEIRVVGLTPPINVQRGGHLLKVRWDRSYKPQPYHSAPVLIDNEGSSNFDAVRKLLAGVKCSTYCGRAASKLRSRSKPIEDPELISQIWNWFDQPQLSVASNYLEVIRSPSSEWLQRGLSAGWADVEERAHRFAERSGEFPHLPDQTLPVEKKGARRAQCTATASVKPVHSPSDDSSSETGCPPRRAPTTQRKKC